MFSNLSAVRINSLAQRLSEEPLGRSASVAAAAERFERLLAAKICADCAPKAFKTNLTAARLETAEGRLVAEIDSCDPALEALTAPEPVVAQAPIAEPVPETEAAPCNPRRRLDADFQG